MNNKNIPEGTRDIIFEEADLYTNITEKFNNVFAGAGFKQIMTPAIEYYDVFDYSGQSIEQEQMYKLTDNNGRLAVLRADNTTPAARLVATKLRGAPLPQKLYYNQHVYRINNGYSGKRNEILQCGVEIIGNGGLKTDYICITTAIEVLKMLGINFKIEIGHVGYFNALIKELNLSDSETRLVRKYVDAKKSASLNNLEKIRRIPLLFGGIEIFDEAYDLAGNNTEAVAALNYVKTLYKLINNENIMIDLGIVHQLDYYTGVVFGGYIEGAGEPVLMGGRYDNLIKNFDYDVPATGFAVNVCLVADVMKPIKNQPSEYIIHFDLDNIVQTETFENSELSCFDTYEETLNYAKTNGIKYVVYGSEVREV
ncbi:MAG: ATP phosphoribosyltransferase regulatory subunit [Oscillospiraceae bacterium]|nr:ATP phosphoribosyltransferase regulatory subunit [Oscillospiraceae bacterium]